MVTPRVGSFLCGFWHLIITEVSGWLGTTALGAVMLSIMCPLLSVCHTHTPFRWSEWLITYEQMDLFYHKTIRNGHKMRIETMKNKFFHPKPRNNPLKFVSWPSLCVVPAESAPRVGSCRRLCCLRRVRDLRERPWRWVGNGRGSSRGFKGMFFGGF